MISRVRPLIDQHTENQGAFDVLTTIAGAEGDTDAAKIAVHYAECMGNTHINSAQLAENVQTFVETRPKLQTSPVSFGLVEYLQEACGPTP
jgi:hypothetical protein